MGPSLASLFPQETLERLAAALGGDKRADISRIEKALHAHASKLEMILVWIDAEEPRKKERREQLRAEVKLLEKSVPALRKLTMRLRCLDLDTEVGRTRRLDTRAHLRKVYGYIDVEVEDIREEHQSNLADLLRELEQLGPADLLESAGEAERRQEGGAGPSERMAADIEAIERLAGVLEKARKHLPKGRPKLGLMLMWARPFVVIYEECSNNTFRYRARPNEGTNLEDTFASAGGGLFVAIGLRAGFPDATRTNFKTVMTSVVRERK